MTASWNVEVKLKASVLRSRTKKARSKAIDTFLPGLKTLEPFYGEFDETVFCRLCEKMTVWSKHRIVVTFKSGYEVETSLG